MPSRTRRELNGHPARSSPSLHGWGAIIAGLFPLGLGVWLGISGASELNGSSGSNVSSVVVLAMGGVFALIGVGVGGYGLRGLRRKARKRRMLELRPDEPWLADHPWNPREANDETLRGAKSAFVWAAVIVAFLAPVNWWGFFSGHGKLGAALFAAIFDLVALYVLGRAMYLAGRRLKYGRSILRFERFPFFLGERLEARVRCDRPIEALKEIRAALRCIEERYETRGAGKNRRTLAVCYRVYEDGANIAAGGRSMSEMPVTFDLPAEDLETALTERPPRYWEIQVRAETLGIDYAATFLVPVYARPGGAPAPAKREAESRPAPPLDEAEGYIRDNIRTIAEFALPDRRGAEWVVLGIERRGGLIYAEVEARPADPACSRYRFVFQGDRRPEVVGCYGLKGGSWALLFGKDPGEHYGVS